jgi:hypothetical protein
MEKPAESGTGVAEKSVILLFSTRERIANVLNVALMQCNYRILLANTSYIDPRHHAENAPPFS